ncbi:MAG: DUF3822 family protein [Bacteroidaceae bacterium]|nr:DUF3822 family protein [Bacteroidaceae bacterium]
MPVTGNKSLLNYSLSIRHRADGFSFYVQSTGSGKVILREDIKLQEGEEAHAALERGLSSKRISGYSYERVNMLVATPSTRLPLDEFRRDDMLAVYRTAYHGTTAKREDIKFQVLPTLEVVELFTLSPQIETTLHQHYPGAVIQGLYGTVLQHISETQQGSTMPLSFHAISLDNQIFIIQLKQGRLTYANTFQATLPEDQLYFLLYIWKLFNLDAHHDICTLYNTTKELLPLVRDFIVNVQTKTIPL